MCTAISYATKHHYFGRNLDLEFSYQETVTVVPRNFPFSFRKTGNMPAHLAMIGMAYVAENYPLYYDATNEAGLSMAGLNFPGNAVYFPEAPGKDNVAPFELIPWVLGQCRTVAEAKMLLARCNLCKIDFHPTLPCSPLHWMLSDRTQSLVVESVADGLKIHENPFRVLTNNPPFEFHKNNLANYRNLTREEPDSRFADDLPLAPYSRGMGAMGLPGDLSSASRFVKAAFTLHNSVAGTSESESVSQFFHILASVAQQRGCVRVGKEFEITVYSSCCNTDTGVYYYTTYENSQISAVDLHREDLDGAALVSYPLRKGQQIHWQN